MAIELIAFGKKLSNGKVQKNCIQRMRLRAKKRNKK